MRSVEAILAAVMTTTLAGCVVGGKPKSVAAAPPPPQPAAVATAPAPPPAPLSIAQTQVVLPPPQPVDPEALPEVSPPEPPADTAPVTSGPRPPRTRQPAAPKPVETAPPVTAPPAAPPATDAHPPIQEVVPESEQKQLLESAQARRKEIEQWLATLGRKRMNKHQQSTVVLIRGFLKESNDAQLRNDMRQADALAERAQILMRELQNGQ